MKKYFIIISLVTLLMDVFVYIYDGFTAVVIITSIIAALNLFMGLFYNFLNKTYEEFDDMDQL